MEWQCVPQTWSGSCKAHQTGLIGSLTNNAIFLSARFLKGVTKRPEFETLCAKRI